MLRPKHPGDLIITVLFDKIMIKLRQRHQNRGLPLCYYEKVASTVIGLAPTATFVGISGAACLTSAAASVGILGAACQY